uniref:hypothetical protein n=1 Tax=Bacteroides ndongoniae TaxID=1903262 RepID=UPI0023F65ABE
GGDLQTAPADQFLHYLAPDFFRMGMLTIRRKYAHEPHPAVAVENMNEKVYICHIKKHYLSYYE